MRFPIPDSLSPDARLLAEFYAVVYPIAPGRGKTMRWLNKARRDLTGVKGISSQDLSRLVDELLSAGLIEPPLDGTTGEPARGPHLLPGHVTELCESAVKSGLSTIVLQELSLDVHAHYDPTGRYHFLPPALEEQVAREALINNTFERYADQPIPPTAWFWLTEPQAQPYLERLPMPQRSHACQFNMETLVYYLEPFETFADICDAVDPGGIHQHLRARGLLFQGRLDDALAVIEKIERAENLHKRVLMECESMRALIATLRGDDKAAFEHIMSTIELERGQSRKRILYPDVLCFTMSLLSLVRLNTSESRAQLDSLLDARHKLKVSSGMDPILYAAVEADKPIPSFPASHYRGPLDIVAVFRAISSRWHKSYHYAYPDQRIQDWLDDLYDQALLSGYQWVCAELQCVIEANHESEPKALESLIENRLDGISAATRHKTLGTKTLTRLVTKLEPWEYSLRQLEQLALKAKPAKKKPADSGDGRTRRLIWKFQQYGHDSLEVTPFEQSLNKKGEWTGGKRVSLKRLRDQAANLPHLISQDIQASATIQKIAYGWGNTHQYETSQRTIYKLVGHPCVFDELGERYDVVEKPPVIQLSDVNEQIRLAIDPVFSGENYQCELDHHSRLILVTHFTAAHRRIAMTLPEKGLLLPGNARERLQTMLEGLSADIAVQGDGSAVQGDVIEGTTDTLLVFEPVGHLLRVRLRVEPLPDSGKFFDAAGGGDLVYQQTRAGPITIKRDLQAEQQALENILLLCPALAMHYDGRPYFVLEDQQDVLELLEEVEQAGVRCVWTGDMPFKVKARVDVGNVRLTIKSARDWLTANGELSSDDKDADPIALAQVLALMQSRPRSRFIELGKGEFLALSSSLKQQLDTLQAYSRKIPDDETSKIQVHPMALLSIDPLMDAATLKADKSLKSRRDEIRTAFENSSPIPAALEAELRPYQLEGYTWLERLGRVGAGACLADDMGLGKTVQSLALILSRAADGPALVVAPTSVAGNWLAEAQRFAPSLNIHDYAESQTERHAILESLEPFDLVVISYGLLVNDIKHLEQVHWHTLILDEAQAIKNAATRRAKCARQLKAGFRVITTGTPIQNNLMDLHSLFSFLNPGLLGSEAAFRQRYLLPISRDQNEHAREQLKKLVSPFMLRRHKRDVLKDLPARTELSLEVALSKEETALYEMIRQEALDSLQTTAEKNSGNGDGEDAANAGQQKILILSFLTRLRRLCCNPSLIINDWAGPMSKLEVFSETLHELIAGGHKALVFSQFVDHLKIIEAHLIKHSISYQYLDGSTTAKQRSTRVNAFQAGNGDVFLISLTAGGTGLNLTAADYVIHLDPWWNPAVEDQASDRAYRIGQQRPVTIIRMVTKGTIEEQIQELHGTKRELADSVLSGADSPLLDLDTMMKLLRGAG